MKRVYLSLAIVASFILLAAAVHDYFLLPENFYLKKGEKLSLHMLEGEQFIKKAEVGFQPKDIASLALYEGKHIYDLKKFPRDSAFNTLNYPLENEGQAVISMVTGVEHNNVSRDSYADFLTSLGYDKLANDVKNGRQFRIREKYTRYMKTLISVENHDGDEYKKQLREDYEIVLKDNPYKKRYGEDFVAQVFFMGKPVKHEAVALYIRSLGGNVYNQNYVTDDKGEFTITMSREGIYLLRCIHVEPSKSGDADYQSWWATYTFYFSSSDDELNSYKDFGFGDVH